MIYSIDKDGYPVERIKGKPVLNFFRLLFLTRSFRRNYYDIGIHEAPAEFNIKNRKENEDGQVFLCYYR